MLTTLPSPSYQNIRSALHAGICNNITELLCVSSKETATVCVYVAVKKKLYCEEGFLNSTNYEAKTIIAKTEINDIF